MIFLLTYVDLQTIKLKDLLKFFFFQAFRKSLMDIAMETGVKDFERLSENRPMSRTAGQRKMIIQSLVVVGCPIKK